MKVAPLLLCLRRRDRLIPVFSDFHSHIVVGLLHGQQHSLRLDEPAVAHRPEQPSRPPPRWLEVNQNSIIINGTDPQNSARARLG